MVLVDGEEQCGNSVLGCNSDSPINNALATRDDFHEDEYERETALMSEEAANAASRGDWAESRRLRGVVNGRWIDPETPSGESEKVMSLVSIAVIIIEIDGACRVGICCPLSRSGVDEKKKIDGSQEESHEDVVALVRFADLA